MKYEVKFTNQFKKDLKLAKKQGKDTEKLFEVIEKLANGEPLTDVNNLCKLHPRRTGAGSVNRPCGIPAAAGGMTSSARAGVLSG